MHSIRWIYVSRQIYLLRVIGLSPRKLIGWHWPCVGVKVMVEQIGRLPSPYHYDTHNCHWSQRATQTAQHTETYGATMKINYSIMSNNRHNIIEYLGNKMNNEKQWKISVAKYFPRKAINSDISYDCKYNDTA